MGGPHRGPPSTARGGHNGRPTDVQRTWENSSQFFVSHTGLSVLLIRLRASEATRQDGVPCLLKCASRVVEPRSQIRNSRWSYTVCGPSAPQETSPPTGAAVTGPSLSYDPSRGGLVWRLGRASGPYDQHHVANKLIFAPARCWPTRTKTNSENE